MKYVLYLSIGVLFVLYSVVPKSIDKYSRESGRIPRVVLALCGLTYGTGGIAMILLETGEPDRHFGFGFVFGPIAILVGLFALIVSVFLPIHKVSKVVRYFFTFKGLTGN